MARPINAERNTAMPTDFLMQQMQWREALDDAKTLQDFKEIADQSNASKREKLLKIEHLLDVGNDFSAAAQQVRALMFIERFAGEVEARIDPLET
jgi:molecular chaperone HscB